jgi:hypothetical protein
MVDLGMNNPKSRILLMIQEIKSERPCQRCGFVGGPSSFCLYPTQERKFNPEAPAGVSGRSVDELCDEIEANAALCRNCRGRLRDGLDCAEGLETIKLNDADERLVAHVVATATYRHNRRCR